MTATLLPATPGQTVGPFFGYALPFAKCNELVPPGSPNAVQLHGLVADANGRGVPDALVEIWQADADGTISNAAGSLRRDGWTFFPGGGAAPAPMTVADTASPPSFPVPPNPPMQRRSF